MPVTVVTGFLGAGKTTLVNAWLGGFARGEVAVIVNEHGDIGIDGELLAARVRTLVEITGGCICCSTQAELVHALDEIAATATPPRRILIETSGAASPAGVVTAIASGGRSGAFVLDGVITVVDATRVNLLERHDLAVEQVGYADVVVLSRTDACDHVAIADATRVIAAHNGAAVVVASARGEIAASGSLDALLAARDGELPVYRGPAPKRMRHVYESVSLSLDGDVDGDRFAEFIETELAPFAGRIFRTKGILAVAGVDERMILQGVADLVEITFGAPWDATPRHGRMVVVGYALDADALRRGFAGCAAHVEDPAAPALADDPG
ncbi:MAG: GTP-binding protein [Deltaproteobacteria bacterium]|nr:GTP-binding protein [Deltaproteobacteria bacterium]